jgi:hypothetical protein
MAMADTDPAYRELIERTGLDPTLVREVEIRPRSSDRDAPGVYLRLGQSIKIPGYGRARFVREVPQALPQVDLPSSLEVAAYLYAPLHPPALAPAPLTAAEYWERIATLAAKAARLQGRLHWSGGRENGWLSIVERAIDAFVIVIEPGAAVDIAMSEHFGNFSAELRVIGGSGAARRYLSDLALWIEAAAVGRCMMLGIPGWRGPFGDHGVFDRTLSDKARELDETTVWRQTYPHPPAMQTGGHDET